MKFLETKCALLFSAMFFVCLFFLPHASAQAACQVEDADFRSQAPWPANNFTFSPGGETFVYIDVQTAGCIGQSIELSISHAEGLFYTNNLPFIDLSNFNNFSINSIQQDDFTLYAKATYEGCDANYVGFDCNYRIQTWDSDGSALWDNVNATSGQNIMLQYDCWGNGSCSDGNTPWVNLGVHDFNSISPDDQFADYVPPDLGEYEASSDYLAPLPGLAGQASGLKGFLQGLFNVAIVVAGILAILMVVIGAITYLSTDSISGTEHGRDMMLNAVLGLILALSAWVIINTINPELAGGLSITIPKVNTGNYSMSEPGVINTTGIPSGVTPNEDVGTSATGSVCKDKTIDRIPNCPTCQAIPSGVAISGGSNNQVVPELGAKLLALENSIPGLNWTVTEAYLPTRAHCGQCHYRGTCIDADFVGLPNPSPAQVKAFIDAAAAAGLDAEWEVKTQAEFNAMVAAGLRPKNDVWMFGSWISGSHFSIYNR